jgi:hypothetical protein
VRLAAIISLVLAAPTFAQKKPDAKDRPQLTFAEPFAVVPGQTNKLKLRGLKLDDVTEVRCHEPKATAKLAGKPAKVSVPDAKLLPLYGDMQIDVELTVPPESTYGEVTISVVNVAGESTPLRLVIDDGLPRVAEKEPNDGFRQAQAIRLGTIVEGVIQSPQDVDVLAFEGKAGQRVVFTAQASRYGSPLEAMLTLYDAAGHVIRSSDDVGRGENARLDLTLPRDGRYYIAVVDAHDTGGPGHRYRLRVEEANRTGRGK